ncbi:MAG: Dipeptide transport system permease protein DppB [Bacteroidetes bacterium ADurb.Bin408]|nr:MAG: Dipeptide transport system permease protein DppB [Bacteroidetes bacterium ADurb.Bin408]
MLRFILKRFYYGFLVLIGVLLLVFFLFNVLPGDAASMMQGQRTDMASLENTRKELGLDKPIYKQFLNYINDISPLSVHETMDSNSLIFFNENNYAPYLKILRVSSSKVMVLKFPYLRRSYQSQRKVSEILITAFPLTALLAGVSILIACVIGIILGIISALNKNSFFDKMNLVISVFGMSLPSFFAAVLIAWIFAYLLSGFTHLNMFGSLYSVDDFGRGEYLELKNIILPAITLGIRPLAIVTELTRSSLLEVMSQDYIRTARAKGLPLMRIITKHALKNAMNPVVTAISGWFASLLAGAVFVEYIFDWKGIGVVMVQGLEKYDFPVVMGTILFISVILIIINIFVDIIYAMLDPRVQIQ